MTHSIFEGSFCISATYKHRTLTLLARILSRTLLIRVILIALLIRLLSNGLESF